MGDDALIEVFRRMNALESLGADERVREAWPSILGDYMMLPELRGLWPCSSVDETATGIRDLSSQGRTLTIVGGLTRAVHTNITPYVNFDGIGSLSRPDEAGLDITGGLTLAGWFWLDAVAATQWLITKFNPTGNQRAYALSFISTGVFRFEVSGDGTAVVQVSSSGFTIAANRWYWIVGRYNPSTEIKLFVGDRQLREFTNTTSIPASLFNSSAEFRAGLLGDGTGPLDGRGTQFWLTASNASDELISQLYMRSRRQFGV